jgi:hypothetical protein
MAYQGCHKPVKKQWRVAPSGSESATRVINQLAGATRRISDPERRYR